MRGSSASAYLCELSVQIVSPRAERDREPGPGNPDTIWSQPRAQVHLDPLRSAAFQRASWSKRAQIERRVQLAVDAGEQVLVERRGDAGRVVVGERSAGRPACTRSVDSSSRSPARMRAAHLAQERVARGTVEVADRAAQEQHEQRLSRPRAARRPRRGRRRYSRSKPTIPSDGIVAPARARPARAPPARCRSGSRSRRWRRDSASSDPARLRGRCRCRAPRPASASADARDDVLGVPPQEARSGARQAVLGQHADRLEQRRADGVVEILGRQLLLSRLRRARRARRRRTSDDCRSDCAAASMSMAGSYASTQRNVA